MSTYAIGVNLGFAVNRYPEPTDWIPLVAEEIQVKRIQFVADLLNPSLPTLMRIRKVAEINKLCARFGLQIESAFTGAFTRVNHFGSEDGETREYWLGWFKEFIRQSAELGATSFGGHPGILSLPNDSDPVIRVNLIENVVEAWQELSSFATKHGMTMAVWEPMSISRELGHTIADARNLQSRFIANGNKIGLCLDLDHGDLCSGNASDFDPYYWIKEFKSEIKMLHLKQTTLDRRRNMSFTERNNIEGTVDAKTILETLNHELVPSLTMFLELGFRERNPNDKLAVKENFESAKYWLDAGATL